MLPHTPPLVIQPPRLKNMNLKWKSLDHPVPNRHFICSMWTHSRCQPRFMPRKVARLEWLLVLASSFSEMQWIACQQKGKRLQLRLFVLTTTHCIFILQPLKTIQNQHETWKTRFWKGSSSSIYGSMFSFSVSFRRRILEVRLCKMKPGSVYHTGGDVWTASSNI